MMSLRNNKQLWLLLHWLSDARWHHERDMSETEVRTLEWAKHEGLVQRDGQWWQITDAGLDAIDKGIFSLSENTQEVSDVDAP